jgi:hypothetical protein
LVLEDEQLLLSLNVYDVTNRRVLKITDNELVYSVSPWDIDFVGKNLTIREAKHKVLLELAFAPPDKLIVRRGHLFASGIELYIKPEYAFVVNHFALLQRVGVTDFARGLAIGTPRDSLSAGLSIPEVERNLSSSERYRRLREAVRLAQADSLSATMGMPTDGPAS